MSQLTLTVLQIGFLVLLWVLVRSQRSFWDYDARHPVP